MSAIFTHKILNLRHNSMDFFFSCVLPLHQVSIHPKCDTLAKPPPRLSHVAAVFYHQEMGINSICPFSGSSVS